MSMVALMPSLCWLRAWLLLHVATVFMLCVLVAEPYIVIIAVAATLWHMMVTTTMSVMCVNPDTWRICHGGLLHDGLTSSGDAQVDGQCVPLARFSHVYLFRIEWDNGQRQSLWLLRDAMSPAAFSRLSMCWWVEVG